MIYLVFGMDDADLDVWRQGIGEEMDVEGNEAILVDVLPQYQRATP